MNKAETIKAAPSPRRRFWGKLANRSKLYVVLLALILPTIAGMVVFNYYPKWGAIKYSFYRWDNSTIEEFRGLKNYIDLFGGADPLFKKTFKLVGILLAANLFKMWPSIFIAIAIHRLKSERWQYIYRVMFVIPMVIPGLVWLLIWKSFYDPTGGILNSMLESTGLMSVLKWLNFAMPQLASAVSPIADRTRGGALVRRASFSAPLPIAPTALITNPVIAPCRIPSRNSRWSPVVIPSCRAKEAA